MNYKQILKQSWETTKRHKVLWIFGMAFAALSSGGGNFNFSGSDAGGAFDLLKQQQVDQFPKETSRVLGSYTDALVEVFANIPLGVWIILTISVLLAIFMAAVVSLYIRNWAKGALIASIHDVHDRKPVSLKSGSFRGRSVVKRLIYLHVVPWLIFASGILLLLTGAVGIFVVTDSGQSRALTVLFMVLVGMAALAGGITTNFIIILAEQLVVREELSAKEAFKTAFKRTKKYLGKMFAMGAINLGIGCAVGCATAIILIGLAIVIIAAISIGKKVSLIIAAAVAVVILAIVLFSALIKGIYIVFNTSTWTLLVREIEKQEQKEKDGI